MKLVIIPALHLLALGIGLGAVLTRGSLMRSKLDKSLLRLVFRYDTMWGIAAVLWIATGLIRLMGQTDKPMTYYMQNHLFLTKMVFLLVIFALEIKPMMILLGWRRQLARGMSAEDVVQPKQARTVAVLSHVEATLVVIMVVLAVGMARGIGAT